MKITLASTTKIVTLEPRAMSEPVQCRVWEGTTDSGIAIHAYIPLLAVEDGQPPEVYEQFQAELLEQAKPTPAIAAIPLRLII